MAALAETAEGQDQLATINPFLHQLLASDGDACVVHGRCHAQVGTVEGQGPFWQCRQQVVLFGPQSPLGIIGRMIPGQGVVQRGAVTEIVRVFIQAMALCIFWAAHRRQAFAHQSLACETGEFAIGVVQGQINLAGAKVDIVIAYAQVQRDQRVALDKLGQPWYQPALGHRRSGIECNGTGNFSFG